jgi:hypothetical protein
MKGYVMNASNIWTHALKRAIGPGQKIELEELYDQYGAKHSIAAGEEFVQWLRSVKLPDSKKWKIVLEESGQEPVEEPEVKVDVVAKISNRVESGPPPMVKKKMEVADIVNLSVRNAREVLPKVTDLNLLKYAMQEANQLSGKDSLCKIIRKRIRDLQIGR